MADETQTELTAEETAGVWLEGERLVVRHGFKLPRVCLHCGGTSDVVRSPAVLAWVPPDKRRNTAVWGALFGAIGGAIAGAMEARHQRTAKMELSICGRCAVQRKTSRLFLLIGLVLWCGLMAYVYTAREWIGPWWVLGLIFGSIIVLLLMIRRFNKRWLTRVHRIDLDCTVLDAVPSAAVTEIVERARRREAKKAKRDAAAEPA